MGKKDEPRTDDGLSSLAETDDDVGAKFVLETQSVESESVERRLLWKIDLVLMPLLTVSYGLQYVCIS
jgi:hypothetical protein